jgi:flagellar motor switch protein FliG
MNTTTNSPIVISNYLGLLKGLSPELKMALAVELINDATRKKTTRITARKNTARRFFGAFQSDKTAEEMISEIRESRHFNRNIAEF